MAILMSQTNIPFPGNSAPIGVFDSGVGGLTVVREIMRALPEESIIYFGDTARVPYGSKSKETVTKWKESIKDYKVSDETKSKMSLKQKGDNNPSAKLTESKVLQIIELSNTKTHTVQEIATIFEVSKGTIENILYGRTWKHVPR